MAVLKSPKNNRNKSKWVSQFANKTSLNLQLLQERRPVRGKHKVQCFTRNLATWVSSSDNGQPLLFWKPEVNTGPRPSLYVKNGKKSFKPSNTTPLVFRSYLRSAKASQRLYFLLNSDTLATSTQR